jgi:hypothetical protein
MLVKKVRIFMSWVHFVEPQNFKKMAKQLSRNEN